MWEFGHYPLVEIRAAGFVSFWELENLWQRET
jgi:hypothetical protein